MASPRNPAQLVKIFTGAVEPCAAGEDFLDAIEPILQLVRNGGELVVHSLAHETYVICREKQKRGAPACTLCDELLQALHDGHCSLRLTENRRGFKRKLSEEFSDISDSQGDSQQAQAFRAHCAGDDAAMCARVFLYHMGATIAASTAASSTES